MVSYPKQILNLEQQLQSYIAADVVISSREETLTALKNIGYYRLRGYCYHLYNNATKKYVKGTTFSDVLSLYEFDVNFSHLLFHMTEKIEVSLRVRLCDALLQYGDALALFNPTWFEDKRLYWKNNKALCSEIERSNDVFIKHNFNNHDGLIPIWAAVEVMSFGNLSKTIKNLKNGKNSPARYLTSQYQFKTLKGNITSPSLQMFSSWIQATSVLRNICAHNGRIYNRAVNTHLQIPNVDEVQGQGRYDGAYQLILAMKYLRPSDEIWNEFVVNLTALLEEYNNVVELKRINFPDGWLGHIKV